MHLLTFMQISQPSWFTRMAVLLTQGIVRDLRLAQCMPMLKK